MPVANPIRPQPLPPSSPPALGGSAVVASSLAPHGSPGVSQRCGDRTFILDTADGIYGRSRETEGPLIRGGRAMRRGIYFAAMLLLIASGAAQAAT